MLVDTSISKTFSRARINQSYSKFIFLRESISRITTSEMTYRNSN